MKINILEFFIAMLTKCYQQNVFSEPNFLLFEATFNILKLKSLGQLIHFI